MAASVAAERSAADRRDAVTPSLHALRAPMAIAAIVIAADQLTKHWALNALGPSAEHPSGRNIDLFWTLRFNLAFNTGMAFSSGEGLGPLVPILAIGVIAVLLISIGKSHISHVGSCLIIAEDGLTDLTGTMGDYVSVQNTEPGHPWLNDIIEKHRNLWAGKAKTIMIRSQAGNPVAIFNGTQVEGFATDVPKSTAFRVDGHYLFVYRCDYTTYDSDLLS